MRGVRSALKSPQNRFIACVHSQRTPTREAVELHESQRTGASWACWELAEDPSGGVQVRVLMDSKGVSGVTVVPLQQGGCCD